MAEEIKRVITIEDKASPALENLVDTANEAAEELNKVDVNIKSFDKTSKSFTNGLNDIAEGFDQIIPGTKQATDGFIKVKNALKLLIANPVILGIGAIVTVVYGLVKAIKKNENAMDSLKTAFDAFEPVIDVFNDAIEAVADGIAVVVERIGKWITKLTDLIGITSEASRAQKALEEQSKIVNDIVNSGLDSAAGKYKDLLQNMYDMRTSWRELQKSMGTSSYKSNAEDFLNTWKGTFENLSVYSGEFRNIVAGINTIDDLSKAYNQLNQSADLIEKQMFDTAKSMGIADSQSNSLADSFSKLIKLNNNANEVLAKGAVWSDWVNKTKEWENENRETYNKLLELYNSASGKARTQIGKTLDELEAQANNLYSNVDKSYDEYIKLSENFSAELKPIMKDAFIQAGNSVEYFEKVWEQTTEKIKMAPSLYKWAQDQLQEFMSVSAANTAALDLTNLFTLDIDQIIANSKAKAGEVPTVKVRIEPLEPVDSDILPGNDLKYTGLVNMRPDMSNFKENLLVILQEQLANLDEYTVEYWEKARQVEDWAWEVEKERLEAEGYTNQQIEALREEHNKRLVKLDKQQVLSAVNATSEGLSSLAAMFDAFADMTGEDSEAAFEQSKKLQIASATVTMLQGIASAIATGMQLGPIAGPIVGAINAATVLASGIANIVKIKKTTFDNASGSSSSISSSATSSSYNPTYTANTTGLSDIDALQGAVSSGVSAGSSAVKVYVTESDISDAVNKKKVKVTESTF